MLQEYGNEWWQITELVRTAIPGADKVQPDIAASVVGLLQTVDGFDFEQVSMTVVLHIIEEGSGVFEIDGRRWEVAANSAIAFFPEQFIHYHDAPDDKWRYRWVRFQGGRAEWALSLCGFTRETPVRLLPDTRPLNHLKVLQETLKHEVTSPHLPLTWCWQLVDMLAQGQATDDADEDLAAACKALIDSDYDQSLTIDEIARRLDVERSTIYRHFHDAYDTSPKIYLDQLRIKKAKLLLKTTSRPIMEIAISCGYNDADYFTRRFRQATGVAPSQWRKQVDS